ncbi:MAG: hypothetical protein H6Q29_1504 [Bacteroidetes bacterium]|nr:hypothetical protein [Bacteroidota bacterium]
MHAAEDFQIRGERRRADGIEVELEEFTEAARIGLVGTPDRSNLIAAEREREVGVLGDDARKRRGQVEAEGDVFLFGVDDREDLLGVLLAVAQQGDSVFLGGRLERHEPVAFIDRADSGDDRVACVHGSREVVPESAQELWLDDFVRGHAF